MSTCSEASFEAVSDPEGSDVEGDSSVLLADEKATAQRVTPSTSKSLRAKLKAFLPSRIDPRLIFFIILAIQIIWNKLNQPASLPGEAKFREEVQAMRDKAEWIFKHGTRHVYEIRLNLTKITCLEDVPKKPMLKWKPDPSRFVGIDFSDVDDANRTLVTTGTPVFEAISDSKAMVKLAAEYEGKIVNTTEIIFIKGCVYISECGDAKVYIKDGDLYFSHQDSTEMLVYTISADDLL